ncbi:uncharacterized protein LOC116294877 [Actinia tenebrosa]|uniref:Uncharacterized protein LOC116294877 n=1 Tax=Actinia tenebrosa TaxID=6105 RepID=A0A6P8HSK8_ACTTE|nr:uncharacterized protein LOC116294877 [Actinia tenebrosa]
MVLCLMVNCHTRSVRDKGISLFRVPSVRKSQGEEAEELSIERRRKWLAAISRVGLSEEIINSGRICSRHFVSGKPAANWDKFNVDWVPTLNLGHNKTVVSEKNSDLQAARSERAKVRRKRQQERALFESAAKVAKLDEEGATIDNISFDSPSLTEEISQIANDLQSASDKSKLHCQDGDLLDGITSKLDELCKITDSSTQTNEVNPEMTESSTQTEELDYMFSQPKEAPFDREDMLEDGKVLLYFTLDCLQLLFYKLCMNM